MFSWLSLLGGAGGMGMDNQSAASQSTPFYNQSGIYFHSGGAGTIDAGDVGSSAAPVRGTGPAPVADSVQPLDFSLGGGGNSSLYLIGGLILVGVVALVFLFKK